MAVKNLRGFTLVEMMVVLALMGVLAATTVIYGTRWRNEYKFSAFHNSVQGAIRAVRMKAVANGGNSVLIVTDASVDSSCNVIPSVKFNSADYSVFGPCSGEKLLAYAGGTATSLSFSNAWYYFLYNPRVYSFNPVTTLLGFNSRGTPIYFTSQSLRITSPSLKKTVTIHVTPLGRTETTF